MELFKEEGKAEGREEGKINNLVSLAKKGLLAEEIAAEEADMSLDEFKKAVVDYPQIKTASSRNNDLTHRSLRLGLPSRTTNPPSGVLPMRGI